MPPSRISLIILGFTFNFYACAQEVTFTPAPGHPIKIETQGSNVKIEEINTENNKLIELDTDKAIHIEVDDYNFDGVTDFSAWHIDDGMGTYSIYRVFIYDAKNNDFNEVFPQCGDEFINLKKDQKSQSLLSTYFEENIPKTCRTIFKKNK